MMYGNRDSMRQIFVDTFRKSANALPLSPMEQIIAGVIREHPEYHALLNQGDISGDYGIEQGQTNPFLHMGMHITIREQVSIDRPAGIAAAWQRLTELSDAHRAEHQMLDCLGDILHQAQRNGTAPDEDAYLQAVRELARL